MRFLIVLALTAMSVSASAFTECTEKIQTYFVGTTEVNQDDAHLWVNFESGGSASISSKSAAYNAALSSVIFSLASDKKVKIRYFSSNQDCSQHHADWVGLWVIK